jgi:hypothetical protein
MYVTAPSIAILYVLGGHGDNNTRCYVYICSSKKYSSHKENKIMDFQKKLKEVLDSIFELNKGFYGIDIDGLKVHDRKKYCDLWASYDKLCRDTKRDLSDINILKEG